MDEKNHMLRAEGHAQLLLVEVIGARLYTGPMFEKYNLVLRFFTGKQHYTAEELGGKGKDGLSYLLKQCALREPTAPRRPRLSSACDGRCESFLLGVWKDGHDGSLRWAWINKCAPTDVAPYALTTTAGFCRPAPHDVPARLVRRSQVPDDDPRHQLVHPQALEACQGMHRLPRPQRRAAAR